MFFPISNSHISPIYLVVIGFLIGVMGGSLESAAVSLRDRRFGP
jgi:hypothetical protein